MKNTVHLCDCMDFMRDLPDNAFDLVISDPPYGIGAGNYKRGGTQYGNSKAKCKEYKAYEDAVPDNKYFEELLRISKKCIIFGANHFISKIPYDSSGWIVWDKDNGEGSGYADCELAWTNFDCAIRRIKYRWAGMLQEKMKNKEERIHVNQKPVDLYKWILQRYASKGYNIFDPNVGSGSIRIACHDLGFDFTGCEIDPDYHKSQEGRYKNHIAQGELFGKDEIQGLVFDG